jgi:hypothetical protein
MVWMSFQKQQLKKNKFESYSDLAEGFITIMNQLKPYFKSSRPGHLALGSHGTVYEKEVQELEAFLRPLWGFAPYLTQQEDPFLEEYLLGIIAGTDPENPNYWGVVEDFDQRIVEMASLSTFLLLNKEKAWDVLTERQQDNLYDWLIQVNQREIPANNWHFFRILVNVAMKHCGKPFSQEKIDSDFSLIDSFYLGEGWYCDGVATQVDYYVSFAIHYYSLLYYKFVPEDQVRGTIVKQRATDFAQTFKYWFAANGEAIPFGRSLAYRFAQVSFFSALVFADVEALPWGEIKGLISRHLHQWMQQDIFNSEGVLTVGYHYQNLVFAEGYNAPGSPYWALKTFILLAIPKDHPYWQASSIPLQIAERTLAHPISKNFYQHNLALTHALMFPAGQFINFQSHASSKYSKFVYSTNFGSSVAKSNYWYYEGNYDNTLALSEDDHYFRTKGLDVEFQIVDDRIIHKWSPWEDVQIKTTIVPLVGSHVRIHEIQSQRMLYFYEGGFSTPKEPSAIIEKTATSAGVHNKIGYSKIETIVGYKTSDVLRTEPNTNLLYPATLLPYLTAHRSAGTHLFVSLVTGLLPTEEELPTTVEVTKHKIIINQSGQIIQIDLIGGKNGNQL